MQRFIRYSSNFLPIPNPLYPLSTAILVISPSPATIHIPIKPITIFESISLATTYLAKGLDTSLFMEFKLQGIENESFEIL